MIKQKPENWDLNNLSKFRTSKKIYKSKLTHRVDYLNHKKKEYVKSLIRNAPGYKEPKSRKASFIIYDVFLDNLGRTPYDNIILKVQKRIKVFKTLYPELYI